MSEETKWVSPPGYEVEARNIWLANISDIKSPVVFMQDFYETRWEPYVNHQRIARNFRRNRYKSKPTEYLQ